MKNNYKFAENSIFYVDYFVNGQFGESRGFYKNSSEETIQSVKNRAIQYFDIVYKKCNRNLNISFFEIHLKNKENVVYQSLFCDKGGKS